MATLLKRTDLLKQAHDKPVFAWPEDRVLDQLSDAEYAALVQQYQAFMTKYWPSCTLYVPRRKTPEERVKEEADQKAWDLEHGLDDDE